MQRTARSRRRRARYRARPTTRQITQTNNHTIQPLAGVSRLDETVQVRKMTYQQTFEPAVATNGGIAYGVGYIKFTPNTQLTDELKALSKVYEQYNVSRMEVYATLGKGYDADNKFKARLYARVDPDDVIQGSSYLRYYFSVLSGQNTTLHTFNQRGRVKIADFRPKFFAYSNDQADTTILPSRLQWYPLDDSHYINQKFTGLMVAGAMPDEGLQPDSLNMVLDVSLTFKFRGRVIADKAYSAEASMPLSCNIQRQLSDFTDPNDVWDENAEPEEKFVDAY